ncbi:MAG: DNA methyltransferase, partial [Candidatus Hodarchaeales archaeon]
MVNSQCNKIRKNFYNDTNYILRGSFVDSLKSIPNLLPISGVKLIIYDLSRLFQGAKMDVLPKYLELRDSEELPLIKRSFGKRNRPNFSSINRIVKSSLPLLINDGFFVVRVNGTVKHYVKILLDQLIGKSCFLNEILLDSQYSVQYSEENNIFERSEYFLVYSKSKNPIIKSVYNEKPSGGYWHSFVSKGQGGSKEFRFDGKSIILTPPAGNHWKLKQETILKMCDEGTIRLNTKGNPEYWVPLKRGQIVDTNWLDLVPSSTYDLRKTSCSISVYSRLFQTLVSSADRVLHLSPQSSEILFHTSLQKLKWICLVEDMLDYPDLRTKLSNQGINNELIDIKSQESKYTSDQFLNNGIEWKPSKKSQSTNRYRIHSKFVYPSKSISRPLEKLDWKNQIILGDCFNVLQHLHKSLKKEIKLIYIDPPFFTGIDERMVIPVGSPHTDQKDSKIKRYPPIEILAYMNALSGEGEIKKFNDWFSQRILLMKPLLRSDGFIFVRFDYHFGHYAKMILDKILGAKNFMQEFRIRRMKKNISNKQINQQTHLIVHSDSLFLYRASPQSILDISKVKKVKRKNQDIAEIEYIRDNIWLDIAGYQKVKRTIFPSENSETLLTRIVEISTLEGDIIADFFAGSGTTLAIAEKLKRKWIGVDISPQAVNEIKKRILKNKTFESFYIANLREEGVNELSKESTINRMKASADIGINIDELKVKVTINNVVLHDLKSEYNSIKYLGLIDYWEIDWNFSGKDFMIDWYSYREIKEKKVIKFVSKSI